MNGPRNGSSRIPFDSAQGIVLSLRSRYSVLRNKVRSRRLRNSETAETTLPEEGHSHVSDTSSTNPWVNAHTQSTLSHRLSFDPGSGVIMLPEDDTWLAGEEDSSDEDYGNLTPPSGDGEGNTSQENLATPDSQLPSTPMTSPKRRHTTYYHHPERRRHTVPGAFPQS